MAKKNIDPNFFERIARLWCMDNGLKNEQKEVVMAFAVFVDKSLKEEPKKENNGKN